MEERIHIDPFITKQTGDSLEATEWNELTSDINTIADAINEIPVEGTVEDGISISSEKGISVESTENASIQVGENLNISSDGDVVVDSSKVDVNAEDEVTIDSTENITINTEKGVYVSAGEALRLTSDEEINFSAEKYRMNGDAKWLKGSGTDSQITTDKIYNTVSDLNGTDTIFTKRDGAHLQIASGGGCKIVPTPEEYEGKTAEYLLEHQEDYPNMTLFSAGVMIPVSLRNEFVYSWDTLCEKIIQDAVNTGISKADAELEIGDITYQVFYVIKPNVGDVITTIFYDHDHLAVEPEFISFTKITDGNNSLDISSDNLTLNGIDVSILKELAEMKANHQGPWA